VSPRRRAGTAGPADDTAAEAAEGALAPEETGDLAAGEEPEDAADAAAPANGAALAGAEATEAQPEAEPELDAPPLGTVLEGVLFAAAEPVPIARLTKLLIPWPRSAVTEALEALRERLEAERRGIRLVETANGYQLRSAAECSSWVKQFFAEKPPRLSGPLLETLAVIAYRQPATRGQIEAVRGVNCDAVLEALLARSLVRVVGRRESPGRPLEYGTTAEFLELFTLRSLDELPPLPDSEGFAELATLGEDLDVEAGAADASGETAEDLEPGRPGLAEGGGGADPTGADPGQWEGDPRAGDEGGSDPGPDHR
jgi:segregation and condensation protein B